MSDWKKYKLGELATIIPGYAFKGKDFGDNGSLVVKIGNIQPPIVDVANCLRIPSNKISGLDKFKLHKGDFVLAMTGATLGKVGRYRSEEVGFINQRVTKFDNKIGVSDKQFLYYLITSNFVSNEIISRGLGSAQPNISGRDIESIDVIVPDLPIQTAIAEILSSLDDKIELNNKINQDLETLVQTIFKKWFIDFEFPNENDLPYKSSDGELVDSELGEIPEGWTCKPLFDCANYINGAAYKDKYFSISEDSLPVIKIVELKTGISIQTKYSNVNLGDKYKIVNGDILFSWSGSPETSIDIFLWAEGNAWLNQHIFKVVCKNSFERAFVYSMLKYWKPVFISIAKDKQTTGLGHVTIKDLKERLQSYPTEKILKSYGKVAIPIIDLILNNLEEKNNLIKLRDTLLPKLISGELEIAEVMAEKV